MTIDGFSDYDDLIKVTDGIFWAGFYDEPTRLLCNPYLIIDGEEAVIIDGGSRPDFPSVMMKILQSGISPDQIVALIYQHYDPDLAGSVSNFEDIIDSQDLKIITDNQNNMYIRHYSISSPLISLQELGHSYKFSSGRELKFINTPYSHTAGSFITLDVKTGTLFTSDLLGSYSSHKHLFLDLPEECADCDVHDECPSGKEYCPLSDILDYHRHVMTSTKAFRFAIEKIKTTQFKIIAPQHGSLILDKKDADNICRRLYSLSDIGIDRIC
jgi:flavorubredoxin